MSTTERARLPEWMRVYYAMTANLDRNVGRLLRVVDDLGLRDNTIFVFTSDHGEMFGAQGRRAKNIFMKRRSAFHFLSGGKDTFRRTCFRCVSEYTRHHADAAVDDGSADSSRC